MNPFYNLPLWLYASGADSDASQNLHKTPSSLSKASKCHKRYFSRFTHFKDIFSPLLNKKDIIVNNLIVNNILEILEAIISYTNFFNASNIQG